MFSSKLAKLLLPSADLCSDKVNKLKSAASAAALRKLKEFNVEAGNLHNDLPASQNIECEINQKTKLA